MQKHTSHHAGWKYTMIQTKITVAIVSFAMVLATLGGAQAYDTDESDKPIDLRIYLTLKTRPIHNNFTRYLTFKNMDDVPESVAVAFTKSSRLTYEGHVTEDGLAILQTFADHDNRSYWDKMYFENKGGSTSLDIESFEAEIEYDAPWGKEPTATIAYTVDKELGSGDDSFRVPSKRGRRVYARDSFGWSLSEYYALPPALQLFISDIGKSGSSGVGDSASADNPKYSSDLEHPLCSETVSWYYYETGVEIDTGTAEPYDFQDTAYHVELHDAFQDAGRLYCFHSGREEWIRKNRSYAWVYGDTYEPQPGDYLNRRNQPGTNNGHSMMMVEWDSLAGEAHVIDGPWNINFRKVDVLIHEQRSDPADGYDYCVGRIPFND